MKLQIEPGHTSQTSQSNLVKPTECWTFGAMRRIGGERQFAATVSEC
jgi:hypothetical protein